MEAKVKRAIEGLSNNKFKLSLKQQKMIDAFVKSIGGIISAEGEEVFVKLKDVCCVDIDGKEENIQWDTVKVVFHPVCDLDCQQVFFQMQHDHHPHGGASCVEWCYETYKDWPSYLKKGKFFECLFNVYNYLTHYSSSR